MPVPPTRPPGAVWAGRLAGILRHPRHGLVPPLLLVTAQVLVNYKTGRISDLHTLYFTHHLGTHPLPYLDARIEYPVLIALYMTSAAALTHSVVAYMQLSSIGLWACALGCTAILWSISRRAAWCFAACPLLLVYSLLNWDLFAILFMLLGWRAWRQVRYAAAAGWLTLGVFTKLYPVVLLLFCLVELVGRERSGLATRRDIRRYLGVAAVVAAVVNVPFMVLAFHSWLGFWSFNEARNDNSGLLSYVPALAHADIGTVNVVLAAVLVAAGAAGALAVARGVSVIHASALFFFAFMLLQKVYSPQYTLWLVVFAVLAEWEFWTISLLSAMGVAEYGFAVIHIALVTRHVSILGWFNRRMLPLNKGFRLVSIGVPAVATGTSLVLRRRSERRPGPVPVHGTMAGATQGDDGARGG